MGGPRCLSFGEVYLCRIQIVAGDIAESFRVARRESNHLILPGFFFCAVAGTEANDGVKNDLVSIRYHEGLE